MPKISVIIALHKKQWFPNLPFYHPLHVGAEGKDDIGIPGDNTGDNISLKNPDYCELTGMYWAWKNQKSDYIGFTHYRRFFDLSKSESFFLETEFYGLNDTDRVEQHIAVKNEIVHYFKNYDIILPRASFLRCNYDTHFLKYHDTPGLQLAKQTLLELYPDYKDSLSTVFNGHKIYFKNMFICHWSVFDDYMNFLFPLLFEVEKRTKELNFPYYPRLYGYLSEYLSNVYFYHNKLRIKEVPLIFFNPEYDTRRSKKIISPRGIWARLGLISWF